MSQAARNGASDGADTSRHSTSRRRRPRSTTTGSLAVALPLPVSPFASCSNTANSAVGSRSTSPSIRAASSLRSRTVPSVSTTTRPAGAETTSRRRSSSSPGDDPLSWSGPLIAAAALAADRTGALRIDWGNTAARYPRAVGASNGANPAQATLAEPASAALQATLAEPASAALQATLAERAGGARHRAGVVRTGHICFDEGLTGRQLDLVDRRPLCIEQAGCFRQLLLLQDAPHSRIFSLSRTEDQSSCRQDCPPDVLQDRRHLCQHMSITHSMCAWRNAHRRPGRKACGDACGAGQRGVQALMKRPRRRPWCCRPGSPDRRSAKPPRATARVAPRLLPCVAARARTHGATLGSRPAR